jgi:FAD/FMN-containing dehydrogenase
VIGTGDPLVRALQCAIGEHAVIADGDLSAWELDWRKRYRGRARAVVRPATTEEVSRVVTLCAAHGAPVVPQGGNTGLVGGGVPDASGHEVVLSLARLNRIRGIDIDNHTMVVEAGCVLQSVQQAAADRGLLFPLSLAAEGSCTIGGNLATNAGGTQVLRYGNARDLCLGLEVVLADGTVWDGLTALRKDNTGYDLRNLFVGSEGTLGVLTAAVLKLFPAPRSRLTAWACVDSLAQAVTWLHAARGRLGAGLTAFEVMNAFSIDLVARHFPDVVRGLPGRAPDGPPAPWHLLLELSDVDDEPVAAARLESLLAPGLEDGRLIDALVASSLTQARTLWHVRECIPLAQAAEGLNIKHDIALPVSAIPGFVAATDAAIQRVAPGARMVDFGHLGDGNLHYNVQAPDGTDGADFLRERESDINRVVYDAVLAAGGSISAEHGIGRLKVGELEARKPAAALALMRAVKGALDPAGVFAPGRVLTH